MAACTGVVSKFDAKGEDLNVSSRPNALALCNPAVMLAPFHGELEQLKKREPEFTNRMGVHPVELSPLHQLKKGAPPTIIFHGKSDPTVPYRTVELFEREANKLGNKCRLVGYEGQTHGFFNYGRNGGKNYYATVRALDEFLISLGYLSGKPTLPKPASGKKRKKK